MEQVWYLFAVSARLIVETTAVRLMWEYYNAGYEPKWIRGKEPVERVIVRDILEDPELELKPKRNIYLEDPFGKIEHEKKENLERRIGTIIDNVKQVEDSYVIITSREEIFKEFVESLTVSKMIKLPSVKI